MAKTYPARLNGQVAFQDWFNGIQEDAKNYTSQWSNVKESTFAGGATGNGLTDDTAAIAAAFADADANNRAVFIPPGTYLTDTINYRMQSIVGTHAEDCILLGKPGQDILHVDPTFGQFTRMGGCWKDFTLTLNDTIDASASFPNRAGVGNACVASDFNDSLVSIPYPPMTLDWSFERVRFLSTGMASGGANNSCGIYEQSAFLSQCNVRSLQFWRLQYGWWNHWPALHIADRSLSHDHVNISGQVHFNLCKNNIRWVNWGFAKIDDLILHDAVGGTSMELKGIAAGASGGNNVHDLHISSIEMEGATVAGLVTDTAVNNMFIQNLSISNVAAPVTWNGRDSHIYNLSLNGLTGTHQPSLILNGHRNDFFINDNFATSTVAYGTDLVSDLGLGNRVFVLSRPGSQFANYYPRELTNRDGRLFHVRDTASQLLGHVDPMFIAGSDLLLNPRSFKALSQVEGTAFTWVADAAADMGVAFRMLTAAGTFSIDDTLFSINGKNGGRIGAFIPPTKVRVYVKCKLATAGTMRALLQSPTAGTTRGSVTGAVGTAYTVLSFDADLTGRPVDETLSFRMDSLAGGGVTPLDVAWVAFRPWAKDWPVIAQQVSADHGDTAATLVATVDPEIQRWNTALTLARAVTLSTTNAYNGAKFRIVREATATGAFNLNVGTGPLKALATASTWCEVHFDGTAWRLTAAGAL